MISKYSAAVWAAELRTMSLTRDDVTFSKNDWKMNLHFCVKVTLLTRHDKRACFPRIYRLKLALCRTSAGKWIRYRYVIHEVICRYSVVVEEAWWPVCYFSARSTVNVVCHKTQRNTRNCNKQNKNHRETLFSQTVTKLDSRITVTMVSVH